MFDSHFSNHSSHPIPPKKTKIFRITFLLFGTEVLICQTNLRVVGRGLGWQTVGLIPPMFNLNDHPTQIPPSEILGPVVQNCRQISCLCLCILIFYWLFHELLKQTIFCIFTMKCLGEGWKGYTLKAKPYNVLNIYKKHVIYEKYRGSKVSWCWQQVVGTEQDSRPPAWFLAGFTTSYLERWSVLSPFPFLDIFTLALDNFA